MHHRSACACTCRPEMDAWRSMPFPKRSSSSSQGLDLTLSVVKLPGYSPTKRHGDRLFVAIFQRLYRRYRGRSARAQRRLHTLMADGTILFACSVSPAVDYARHLSHVLCLD